MLILKSPFSIDSITDLDILKLVKLRHDQLGDEMFDSVFIIEAGDSLSDIEQEIGFSILTNLFDDKRYPDPDFVPCFEVLEVRILTIMNPHSYHREHLLYSRIGLGVFLR